MKREMFDGKEVLNSEVDGMIDRLANDRKLNYIVSGNKYVFRNKYTSQIYICRIEEVVDLTAEKEECESCKQYMVCAEHGVVDPSIIEDVPVPSYDLYNEAIDKMKQEIDHQIMMGPGTDLFPDNYDLCNKENIAALQKQTNFELTGDCIAQCLNCVWLGQEGYKCTCGNPMMSMDYSRIQKEKENGEAGRNMKKCFGCRQNLPLGSGQFHYYMESNGNSGYKEIPCTHNPNTGEEYPKYICVVTKPLEYIKTDIQFGPPRCDCGAKKCKTTCANWCSTNE